MPAAYAGRNHTEAPAQSRCVGGKTAFLWRLCSCRRLVVAEIQVGGATVTLNCRLRLIDLRVAVDFLDDPDGDFIARAR